jgi:glyoxylase-like metal-dependent hydrolase (beta-lactamase superfamily II)
MPKNVFTILFAALAACSSTVQPAQQVTTSGNVEVVPLGNDVFAAIRREPLSLAVNSNSLFIVNSDHVVVVDAQFTRAATEENIAALKRITSKPVRYVINTHWHDDHLAGNQVYQDAFPGVRFIAQANTRTDLIEKGRPNRQGQFQFAGGAADRFERLVKMGLGGDSTATTPMESSALTSAVTIIRQYIAENNGYREVLPDSLVDRSVTLSEGGRTIELHWFGRANTRGDLVTWLPKERIVSTGDLVVYPIPFTFNSYPTEWIAVLDSVKALAPAVLVPGHGPVMRDLSYVNTVQRMLASTRAEAVAKAADVTSADSLVAALPLTSLRDEVAGNEKWMRTMFGMFFRRPVLGRLYEEIRAGSLK